MPPMPDARENRIGRFEILAELGHGAMGTVYKARDPQLDRIVAIKTLRVNLGLSPEQLAAYTRRFYQEAMAAGRLSHPNIVAVYDVVEIEDTPYIVMEYVEGQTLSRLMAAEAPLPLERAVEMARQVCGALEYAHARGVVHRDIKPSNILVAGGRQMKVGDFGIARIVGKKLTQTGALLGSPSYMSPEQVRGREVDGRSDIFSLGVVLYEALTGADAFPGENPSTVLYNIVHQAPVPIPERNPAVFPALDAVVLRALAKEPEQRYPTARAFADALSQAMAQARLGATTGSQETRVQARPRGGMRRRAVGIGVGAGCAAIAIAGGAWFWSRSPDEGGSIPQATPPAATAPAVPSDAPPPPKKATGGRSIQITTNASVEVFVDGRFRGRVGKGPFVVSGLPVGAHLITLRLGPVEQRFRATVRRDEPFLLTYYFPR